MVFQSDNLVGHLNLDQNVAAAQRLAGRPDADRRRQLLDQLGLSGRARAYPSELSGGESVRAGIAVALANDPPLLLADEPTGEVDSATETRVLELLRDRAAQNGAVVVVTHSDAVAAAADRTVRIVDGRVHQ
jgi:putative ABC transport system ATP-binding protein